MVKPHASSFLRCPELLADALLALASAYHLTGALYALGALKRKREKEFSFADVTAVVPAKSEDPDMLKETVEKILEELEPVEVIVVTDPESFPEVAKRMPEKVKVMTGAEKGKAHALNVAAREAKGEYIMVFDADSYPVGLALKPVPYAASLWKGYGEGRWGKAVAKLTTLASIILIYGRKNLGLAPVPPGSGVLVKKDLLERLGGWDERALTEDIDLALKALEVGVKAEVLEGFVAVEAPPGYPELKKQQRRWAYGAVQALRRRFRAVLKSPELFLYLTKYAYTWLPLVALLASPLGLSPLSLLAYYASVALEGLTSRAVARAWNIDLSLRDSARVSAAGLAMSIDVLLAQIKALVGLPLAWEVTPKRGRRKVERPRYEYLLLLTPLFVLANPVSAPLALQYLAASAFVLKEWEA